jgi:hypothetical protein
MQNGINQAVLVLNSSFEAINIVQARRAFIYLVNDKAVVQEDTGKEFRDGIMFPLVVRLKEFAKIPHRTQIMSRKNILSRDHYMCQYCDKRFSAQELTLDHIVPQSKGGPSTWDNLVAACQTCNRRKADKSLEESGMTLRRRPRPATIHTSRSILRSMGADSPSWQKYLFYDSKEHHHVTRGH